MSVLPEQLFFSVEANRYQSGRSLLLRTESFRLAFRTRGGNLASERLNNSADGDIVVNIVKGIHKSQAQRHGRTARICQTAMVAALVSLLGQPVFGGDDTKELGTYRTIERPKNAAETADEDHSAIQQLMLQIEELQSRVRELEAKEPTSLKDFAPTSPSAALPSSPAFLRTPGPSDT